MKSKILSKFLYVLALAAVFAVSVPNHTSAASRFYNTGTDSRANNNCDSGDAVMNPGVTFTSGGHGVVYYCLHTDQSSDINLGQGTLRQGSSCPAGHGTYDAGGFGIHCIPNSSSSSFFASTPTFSSTPDGSIGSAPTTPTGSSGTIADEDGGKIIEWVQMGINALTGLAGLAITAAVIMGGIQYSTSGGNPQAAAAAKKRITNAMLALLAMVFLYTFLQWIVPGGAF